MPYKDPEKQREYNRRTALQRNKRYRWKKLNWSWRKAMDLWADGKSWHRPRGIDVGRAS